MISTVLTSKSGFTWLDVVQPTTEELDQLALTYGLHATAVKDCLDPEHLPKFERYGDLTFIIARAYDEVSEPSAETIQQITRKIAVFFTDKYLISIHRKDQAFFARLREEHIHRARTREARLSYVLTDMVNAVVATYEKPLEESEHTIEQFEDSLFDSSRDNPPLQRIHILKRRVNLIKRILWQTMGVIHKMKPPFERNAPLFQDASENAESYHFYADELLEEVNNLLSIHLSMASHKTNEVMRVLTVFSAFFLPLTFIVGVYGMNFEFMPELDWKYGYALALGIMAALDGYVFYRLRKAKWL